MEYYKYTQQEAEVLANENGLIDKSKRDEFIKHVMLLRAAGWDDEKWFTEAAWLIDWQLDRHPNCHDHLGVTSYRD